MVSIWEQPTHGKFLTFENNKKPVNVFDNEIRNKLISKMDAIIFILRNTYKIRIINLDSISISNKILCYYRYMYLCDLTSIFKSFEGTAGWKVIAPAKALSMPTIPQSSERKI